MKFKTNLDVQMVNDDLPGPAYFLNEMMKAKEDAVVVREGRHIPIDDVEVQF